MSGFTQVLLYAIMPFAGNFFGGLVAEFTNLSQRSIGLALHLASGVMISVIAVELMPEITITNQAWIIVLALLAGTGFSILVDKGIDKLSEKKEKGGSQSAWMIYFAVCVDLFSDGLMLGTGSAVSASLGFVLALGQVIADVPEGLATVATFKSNGLKKSKRYLISLSFLIPVVLGATIGYWLVKGRPEVVKLSFLAFTVGILAKAAVEEVLNEAHKKTVR